MAGLSRPGQGRRAGPRRRLDARGSALVASLAEWRGQRNHGRAALLGLSRRSAVRVQLSRRHDRRLGQRTHLAEPGYRAAHVSPEWRWAIRHGGGRKAPGPSHQPDDRVCQSRFRQFGRSRNVVARAIGRRCGMSVFRQRAIDRAAGHDGRARVHDPRAVRPAGGEAQRAFDRSHARRAFAFHQLCAAEPDASG